MTHEAKGKKQFKRNHQTLYHIIQLQKTHEFFQILSGEKKKKKYHQ
jgi:hypothetical protein